MTDDVSQSKRRKLDVIKRDFFQRNNLTIHDKWFVNLTNVEFPLKIKWLLSLGGKFALPIPPGKFPLFDMIVDLEECLRQVDDEHTREVARARVTNLLSKRCGLLTEVDRTIIKIHDDCAEFLKNNDNLIIVKADKGGATVAMFKSDYHAKMIDLLSDTTTYQKQLRNPIKQLEARSNYLVEKLYKEKVIDEPKRRSMTRHNTRLARIYALPKVHKLNAPLRPIVSTIDSPAAVLSQYTDGILRCLLHDKYDVKNSLIVKERLNEMFISRNETLVSFDVVSLFPSIPIDLVLKILTRKWNVIKTHTNMPKMLFFDIIRFVLIDSTFFDYDGTVYRQMNGCAMGSNISPTIASIVTNELFDVIIPQLPFELRLLLKYVDDILAIVPKRLVSRVLTLLNSFDAKIQFTMELEKDDTLPYLDLLIIRDNNKIITNWYRKPTASNMSLNYLSNHPRTIRENVAFNMFYRAISLSDERFHQENIEKVKSILSENNFPFVIITKQLHRTLQRLQNNHQLPQLSTGEPPIRRCLTYDKGISDALRNVIVSSSNNKIQVLGKPSRCLRNTVFSKLKTPIDPLERTNVIYEIPCDGNNNERCELSYVGQTRNQLKKRLSQHRNDIKADRNPNGQSAVVSHFTDTGHFPAFDRARVLASESFWSRRNTYESLHIYSRATYNLRRDTNNMAASYCALIDNLHSTGKQKSSNVTNNTTNQHDSRLTPT